MSATKRIYQACREMESAKKEGVPPFAEKILSALTTSASKEIHAHLGAIADQMDVYCANMHEDLFKFTSLRTDWFGLPHAQKTSPEKTAEQIYHSLVARNLSMESLAKEGVAFSLLQLSATASVELMVEDLKGRRHSIARHPVNPRKAWHRSFYQKGNDRLEVVESAIKPASASWIGLEGSKHGDIHRAMSTLRAVALPISSVMQDKWLWYSKAEELTSPHPAEVLPVPHGLYCPTVNAQLNKVSRSIVPAVFDATFYGETYHTLLKKAKTLLSEQTITTPEALNHAARDPLSTHAMDTTALEAYADIILNPKEPMQTRAEALVQSVLMGGGGLTPKPQRRRHTRIELPVSPSKSTGMTHNGTTPKAPSMPPKPDSAAPLVAKNAEKRAPVNRAFNTKQSSMVEGMTAVLNAYADALEPEPLVKRLIEAACPDDLIPMSEDDHKVLVNKAISMKTHRRLATHELCWMADFLQDKLDKKPKLNAPVTTAPPKKDVAPSPHASLRR